MPLPHPQLCVEAFVLYTFRRAHFLLKADESARFSSMRQGNAPKDSFILTYDRDFEWTLG